MFFLILTTTLSFFFDFLRSTFSSGSLSSDYSFGFTFFFFFTSTSEESLLGYFCFLPFVLFTLVSFHPSSSDYSFLATYSESDAFSILFVVRFLSFRLSSSSYSEESCFLLVFFLSFFFSAVRSLLSKGCFFSSPLITILWNYPCSSSSSSIGRIPRLALSSLNASTAFFFFMYIWYCSSVIPSLVRSFVNCESFSL